MKEHQVFLCFEMTWDPLSPERLSGRWGLGHCPHQAPCPGMLSGLPILSSWMLEGGLAAAQKEDLPHPTMSHSVTTLPSKIEPWNHYLHILGPVCGYSNRKGLIQSLDSNICSLQNWSKRH